MHFYIKKRWLFLSLAILISIAVGYIYLSFFQEDNAEKVCCTKHYLTPPKVLTITESSPISNLDSSKADQQITYNLLNQVQEGLMRLGPNNVPVLGLAESYQVSPDYRTYTFSLRKNSVWSDGTPVTANDFKSAWERALSPANQYEYAFLFFSIHNAEKFANGEIDFNQVGVTTSDEKHLTVHLDKPDPNFLSLLTLTPLLPQRSDLVEKYGEEYASTPESMSFTGPFVLKTVTPKKAVLIKNSKYWDNKHVKLSEVVVDINVDALKQVALFKSESTGMTKLDSTYIKMSENKSIKFIPKTVTDFLEMNERNTIFKNGNVRKSIQLALNTNLLIKKLPMKFSAAKKLIHSTQNEEKTDSEIKLLYQIDQAKLLLNKGLKELGKTQINSKDLILVTYNDPQSKIIANEIKKQLALIGLNIKINEYDAAKKTKVEDEGGFDLSISEWSLKYENPIDFLSLWHSNESFNISGFSDTHYDSLLDQASLEINPTKREKLLQDAERYLIMDKAVIMPLVNVNDLRLQKSYVKNVYYHPFGADYSLKWATYSPPKSVEATK